MSGEFALRLRRCHTARRGCFVYAAVGNASVQSNDVDAGLSWAALSFRVTTHSPALAVLCHRDAALTADGHRGDGRVITRRLRIGTACAVSHRRSPSTSPGGSGHGHGHAPRTRAYVGWSYSASRAVVRPPSSDARLLPPKKATRSRGGVVAGNAHAPRKVARRTGSVSRHRTGSIFRMAVEPLARYRRHVNDSIAVARKSCLSCGDAFCGSRVHQRARD
ncbi:hypothetical protein C8Q77DRAFT_793956 [Trametes polyzona]|nr:hypothetical protein C8Q77DRAFT_793956 [Trametes polyzona]